MASNVDKVLDALIKERDGYDSEVRLGYIHSNLDKCKAVADKYGIPMFAAWSNPGCGHCHILEKPFIGNNAPTLKKWMQEESNMIFCYVADTYDQYSVKQGSENGDGRWYWFCKQPNGLTSYPFVRLYWYKNGQKICDVSVVGDRLDRQQGVTTRKNEDGTYIKDFDKCGKYIIEGINKYLTGYSTWDKKHDYHGKYEEDVVIPDDGNEDPVPDDTTDDEENKVEKTVNVVFKDFDGKIIKSEIVGYGKDATPPQNPSRNGYRFIGWDGVYTVVTQNVTCIAVYEKITNTVNPSYKRTVTEINRDTTLYAYNGAYNYTTITSTTTEDTDDNDENDDNDEEIGQEDIPIYTEILDDNDIKKKTSFSLSTGCWYKSGIDSQTPETDPVWVLSTALSCGYGVVVKLGNGKYCSTCNKFDKYSQTYKLRDDIVWIESFQDMQDLTFKKSNKLYSSLWNYLNSLSDLHYMTKEKTYTWPHIVTIFQKEDKTLKTSVSIGSNTIVTNGYNNFQPYSSEQYKVNNQSGWDVREQFKTEYGSTYSEERGAKQLSSFIDYIFDGYHKPNLDEPDDFQEHSNVTNSEILGNIKYVDKTTYDNFKTGVWYGGDTIEKLNEYAKQSEKPLLILMSSTGCTYCDGFAHYILQNEEFIKFIGKQKLFLYMIKVNLGNWSGPIAVSVRNIVGSLGSIPRLVLIKNGVPADTYVYRGGYKDSSKNTYVQTENTEVSIDKIKSFIKKNYQIEE